MINNKLLEILVCPLCKSKLEYQKTTDELICNKCKLAYQIDEGIPVMLTELARKLDDEQ